MPDIIFILVLALVIFGPRKMPEIARQIGRYLAQFRQIRDDFRNQLENEMLKTETAAASKEKRDSLAQVQGDSSPSTRIDQPVSS
jgi:Sec-independent protein translocase protein TatA